MATWQAVRSVSFHVGLGSRIYIFIYNIYIYIMYIIYVCVLYRENPPKKTMP